MASPLLVVDSPSLMYRAFFALPDSIKGEGGRPVNALLGTANLVLREVEDHAPRAVVLCFGAEAAKYRKALYPPYHAERPEVPEKLAPQFADASAFFGAFGWTIAGDDELEADDLLGSYAKLESKAGGRTLLFTGDRDMFQCAGDDVTVLYARTGGNGAEVVGPAEVRKKYGVDPALVPDFIALRGDPSDGLPGAKGVGEKTAAELLREHGSLEAILDNALAITRPKLRTTLLESRDELTAFKDIATLRDAKVNRPKDRETDWRAAAEAATERGMNRLGERLLKLGGPA